MLYARPPGDFIQTPHEGRFLSVSANAAKLLHELVHWSEWRLNWLGSYAEGELRAEIGSCFLSAALNIPESGELTNHTAYIASWIRALENDSKYIFRASSAASAAADFILSFSRPQAGQAKAEEQKAAVA